MFAEKLNYISVKAKSSLAADYYLLHSHCTITHLSFLGTCTNRLTDPPTDTHRSAVASAPRPFLISPSLQTLAHHRSYFRLHLATSSSRRVALRLPFSAAVHPEYQKAKEHSDSHKRDGRGGGEELPVVDAKVPHHGQYHHKHRHH